MNPAQTALHAEHGSLKYVLLPAAVAALGGLLFGFDTAVINGAIVFLKLQFALTDSQTEIAASSLLLGCVFGAGLVAFSVDRRHLVRKSNNDEMRVYRYQSLRGNQYAPRENEESTSRDAEKLVGPGVPLFQN